MKLAPGTGKDLVTASVARTPSGGATAYDTVKYEVPVSDASWAEITGTYTHGTTDSQLELYLESPDATQSFLVDDVTIVGEPAAPTGPGAPVTLTPYITDFETGVQA